MNEDELRDKFYRLALLERDHERLKNARLQADIDAYTGVASRLADAQREIERLKEEQQQLLTDAQAEEFALREEIDQLTAERDALRNALLQIKVLAEYATSGPATTPRCKSDPLNRTQATSLRGSISELCDAAMAQEKR